MHASLASFAGLLGDSSCLNSFSSPRPAPPRSAPRTAIRPPLPSTALLVRRLVVQEGAFDVGDYLQAGGANDEYNRVRPMTKIAEPPCEAGPGEGGAVWSSGVPARLH